MPFPNLQKHQQIERFGLFTTTPVFESISKCPQTDSKLLSVQIARPV